MAPGRPNLELMSLEQSSRGTWLAILKRLYPVYPRPQLTVPDAFDMLPVVHQYGFKSVLSEVLDVLGTKFPGELTTAPYSPCYIIRWLNLADTLQLDALRAMCMRKVRDMAFKKELEAAVLVPPLPRSEGVRHATGNPNAVVPEMCPCGCENCIRIMWCATHKGWECQKLEFIPATVQILSQSSPRTSGSLCSIFPERQAHPSGQHHAAEPSHPGGAAEQRCGHPGRQLRQRDRKESPDLMAYQEGRQDIDALA